MKRQYWIAGSNRALPLWPLLLAVAGLLASFAYGALIVLPRFEPLFADALRTVQPVPQVPAVTPAEVTTPSADAPARLAEQSEAAVVVSDVAAELAFDSGTFNDACEGAMAAALANARIEFLSSSADIVPASRNVVSVLAALSHACPGKIVIAGHSDNFGPEEVNQAISLQRAQSVADAFVDFGVEQDRLSIRGFGSMQPVADNQTRAGRARNRRIEMWLLEDNSGE